MTLPPVVILDASVLINFLKISRVDLLKDYPAKVIITEHVRAEVTIAYHCQLARLEDAISAGVVEELVINDLLEIEQIVQFRIEKSQNRLGMGECSAIIAATRRGFSRGIDDGPAIKIIQRELPELRLLQTKDLIVQLIHAGIVDVATADQIKDEWSAQHKFKLKFKSFAQLLK